jgi:hypothetical protein
MIFVPSAEAANIVRAGRGDFLAKRMVFLANGVMRATGAVGK